MSQTSKPKVATQGLPTFESKHRALTDTAMRWEKHYRAIHLITRLGDALKINDTDALEVIVDEVGSWDLWSLDNLRTAAMLDHAVLRLLLSLAEANTEESRYQTALTYAQQQATHDMVFLQGIEQRLQITEEQKAQTAQFVLAVQSAFKALQSQQAIIKSAYDAREWKDCLTLIDAIDATPMAALMVELVPQKARCLEAMGEWQEARQIRMAHLGEQSKLILPMPDPPKEEEIRAKWKTRDGAPMLSVLCICYNHRPYLEDTLRGIMGQITDFPYEVIVHDDASDDGTKAIIDKWAATYPNIIKPIYQSLNIYSKGISPFDISLKAASGQYIACCEGDDYWINSDKLQRQVDFLQQNPDFVATAHNYYLYEEDVIRVREWIRSRKQLILNQKDLQHLRRFIWMHTLVFRRILNQLPIERRNAAFGDQLLATYLGYFGKCMYFENKLDSVRRINSSSEWSPLPEIDKERRRVKTWFSIVAMHMRMGGFDAAATFLNKINQSNIPASEKASFYRKLHFFGSTSENPARNGIPNSISIPH